MRHGKTKMSRTIVVTIFCLWRITCFAQAAHCIKSTGAPYLLDAILGSLGACNCEKSIVILTEMPPCDTKQYDLIFIDEFEGNSLDTSLWELQRSAQGALQDNLWIEYNTLDNVSVSDGI